MSGHIPKSFIDDLLARTDITELVDARVPLKKAGRNLVACCPFHNEKTPSFTVSPEKQFYHCFGCGAHGTALGFLMEYDRLSFPEAVEMLALQHGLDIPKEDNHKPSRPEYTDLYTLLQDSAQFYKSQLKVHEPAIQYLKQRNISGKTAASFMIGFAPQSWDKLLNCLGSSAKKAGDLLKLGLIIENNQGGHYDRFRNRIMFPIRDSRGRVIAFGGRVIDPNDNPKYMNSPESAVFHKGNELYGLYELRQHKQKLEHIIVVEGYMDVIGLAENDVHNAVATLGTATSSEHLIKLLRICKNITFCFDGDRAGKQAAWRALENSLAIIRSGHEIQFMFLPEGEDPDSIVRKEGRQAFTRRTQQAKSLSTFLFEHLQESVNLSSVEGKAKLNTLAQPLIKKVNDHLYQQLLIKQLSELIGLSEEKIWPQEEAQATPPPQRSKPNRIKLEMGDIRIAIAALISAPKLGLNIDAEIKQLISLDYPGIPLLVDLINTIQSSPQLSPGGLLQRYTGSPHESALIKLASYEFVLDAESGNTIAEIFQDTLKRLTQKAQQQRYEQLIQKPFGSLSQDEKNELKNRGKP